MICSEGGLKTLSVKNKEAGSIRGRVYGTGGRWEL
jgi:hypothetical protein